MPALIIRAQSRAQESSRQSPYPYPFRPLIRIGQEGLSKPALIVRNRLPWSHRGGRLVVGWRKPPAAAVATKPTSGQIGQTWNETPGGAIDGINAAFTLATTPVPAISLLLTRNGLLQRAGSGNDFTLSGSTITFESSAIPQTGDWLLASYTT